MTNAGKDPQTLPSDLIVAMLVAMEPIPPAEPGRLKQRIFARIATWNAAPDKSIRTVREADGAWVEAVPGMECKMLFDDGRMCTWLARARAGTRVPAHSHVEMEECLVLEGSIYIGDSFMVRGDYQVALAGSAHAESFTPAGCVLLMRSASTAMRV